MPEVPLIHVIDDDIALRTALGSLFRSVGYTVKLYSSATDFIETGRADLPGCIVLDVRLPGTSGLELQEYLARLEISLPVVLMTGFGDIQMSVKGMKAGAVDFLTKPFRDQDMLDAVSAAIDKDRKRRARVAQVSDVHEKYALLSPREQQVMKLVTLGKMNKQVAGDLNLSEITVKIHRGSAMRKMQARSLAELVKMAEILELHA